MSTYTHTHTHIQSVRDTFFHHAVCWYIQNDILNRLKMPLFSLLCGLTSTFWSQQWSQWFSVTVLLKAEGQQNCQCHLYKNRQWQFLNLISLNINRCLEYFFVIWWVTRCALQAVQWRPSPTLRKTPDQGERLRLIQLLRVCSCVDRVCLRTVTYLYLHLHPSRFPAG